MPVGGNFTNCNCGPGQACENPTQPVATVGLCLADGTPIAVTVVRDCAGNTTSEGWINLATGIYTTGPAPEGVTACGDSRSITTNGTFCDVDPDTGDVLGLVLVEYQYAPDGSIDSVRLVDAVTGDTYTPQGTITTCPAGVEAPERDLLQLCDVIDDESGALLPIPFVRDYQRSETGQITGHTDYTLDGQPYTPSGTVGVCQAQPEEPCGSTVTVLRLCDLNPDVAPDSEGKRCAVSFLRHLVHDCTGALVETRDTAMDGVTPYTSVEAVDCGSGGVPAMVEVPWEVVDIQPDPASPAGRGFIFSLSPIDDPSTVGTVTVTTSATANTACPGTPPQYNFRNPCTYTFTPDQALRDAATYVRCDLLDFDSFEPVTSLTPPPSRLGGTAYWDGSTVRPTVSNGTGEMYYDNPPASWSYRVGNTGGGNSCSALSFAAVSLRPEGCCAPCGSSGGDGTGRTVQEVCVIANSAPDQIMRWTRVIEDGGATIYYLDQNGDRYDNTLPAGHQIVACPGDEPEPCRDASSLLVCDVADQGPVSGALTAAPVGDPSPFNAWRGYGVPADTWCQTSGDPGTLFSGGSATLGPGAVCPTLGAGTHEVIAAVFDDPGIACEDVTVTASVRVANLGPAAGYQGDGRIALWNTRTGTRLAFTNVAPNAPVGHVQTVSVAGQVSGADLADGDIAVSVDLETEHAGAKSWQVDQFTAAYDGVCVTSTQFLRTVTTDCEGGIVAVTDTDLDGAPYTVAGEVRQCVAAEGGQCCPPPEQADLVDCDDGGRALLVKVCDSEESPGVLPEPCPPVQVIALCDVLPDGQRARFLRAIARDCATGAVTSVTDTELDAVTPYTPAGEVGDCGCPQHLLSECRWDDTDADGIGDLAYVELIQVDGCTGALTPLGTYLPDMTGPYEPVAPVADPPVEGAPPVVTVQARRVELAPGGTWSAASVPLLQSVTATAHGGAGTVVTADGPSTLYESESVTWSVARSGDALLAGPLTVTAGPGTVTVAYTVGGTA